MKNIMLALVCLALALPAAAEGKKESPAAAKPDAAGAGDAKAPASKEGDADLALNAIGLSIARSLEPLALSPAELDKVVGGLREGFSGKAKQKPDDKSQENLRAFVQARMAVAAEKEKARGAAYAEAAAKEKGAFKTANGAIVVPLQDGSGAAPGATDKVKVNYTGTLVGGKVFDATSQHSPPGPVEFVLNGVIPCWTEALQKMKVGGHAKVVCPSAIAYGEQGRPPVIPGNATLTFDIELLEVTKAPPPAPAAPATPAQPSPPK